MQMNPVVGDLDGNVREILRLMDEGRSRQADLLVFPELSITGYPPEDLLLLPDFLKAVEIVLQRIIAQSNELTVIVGLPRKVVGQSGIKLHNSAAIIQNGSLLGFADKILLPTYDVFDEKRYFEAGEKVFSFICNGKKVAVTICEDLWQHGGFLRQTSYARDPVFELAAHKPDLLLNLSASPYHFAKHSVRVQVCLAAAKTLNCPVLLCNQVGGNDSLIFDGYSLHVDQNGLLQSAKGFSNAILEVQTDAAYYPIKMRNDDLEDLFHALVLGVKDYFLKQGFQKACLGLSGGIDSALVLCIATEALGSENVLALIMPSRYTSPESNEDALTLAHRLNVSHKILSVEEPLETYLNLLAPSFEGRKADVTEENLQARIRGMLLMAFSNKFGYIVLSTGNKSEMAMGYSTLYGDMCGGLGVINDLSKKQVYALSRWINRHKEIIPKNTIDRPPSAELRPNQKDSDSLPDYAIIDQVIEAYVEDHESPTAIALRCGLDFALVEGIIRRIHQNEYKRRQAPPGLRVTEKAFSVGRRFPIVQKWVK